MYLKWNSLSPTIQSQPHSLRMKRRTLYWNWSPDMQDSFFILFLLYRCPSKGKWAWIHPRGSAHHPVYPHNTINSPALMGALGHLPLVSLEIQPSLSMQSKHWMLGEVPSYDNYDTSLLTWDLWGFFIIPSLSRDAKSFPAWYSSAGKKRSEFGSEH